MAPLPDDIDARRIRVWKLLRFAALVWAGIALCLLVFWAFGGFHHMGLSIAGAIALILGILFTCALAIGLMALVFYSDASNADEEAYRFKAAPPPSPKDDGES
jgi:amino acid transporter